MPFDDSFPLVSGLAQGTQGEGSIRQGLPGGPMPPPIIGVDVNHPGVPDIATAPQAAQDAARLDKAYRDGSTLRLRLEEAQMQAEHDHMVYVDTQARCAALERENARLRDLLDRLWAALRG